MIQLVTRSKYFNILLLFVVAGAFLFNSVFWKEKLALNLAIFSVFSMIAIVLLYKDALKNNYAKWLLAAVICSLAMVLIYNSAVSSIACLVSVVLFTSYSKYKHRSPVYAIASAMQSLLYAVPQFFIYAKQHFYQVKKAKSVFNKLRIAIIPVLLMLVFFFVYTQSSKVFSNLLVNFADQITKWIEPVLSWVHPMRLLFLMLGFLITGGLLYRCFKTSFQEIEEKKNDDLQRKKRCTLSYQKTSLWQDCMEIFIGRKANSPLALKYEYKAGFLSLIILNVLLVTVNATDVLYLWMGRQYEPGFAWANYVHEGAEMLIVSILMAMLLVLFFFRGNLNFFRDKKSLLVVAYIWLLQNAFLAASVCLRNYYYITHMALTYKRVGLFVFILLVFVGLISVYLKIKHVKSNYYIIKFNVTTGLAVLVLAAFFQWDVLIANYNLQHKNQVPLDEVFLLTLSDHALPVLQQHKKLFSNVQILPQRGIYPEYSNSPASEILDDRIKKFLQQQNNYTWLSWNLADANTKKQLLQFNHLSQN